MPTRQSPDGGVRTQRTAFKRVFGIGYCRFHQIERLDAARDALRAPMPGANITTIATACGFVELGRFAVAYRDMFGETPSATLRRARGATGPKPRRSRRHIESESSVRPGGICDSAIA